MSDPRDLNSNLGQMHYAMLRSEQALLKGYSLETAMDALGWIGLTLDAFDRLQAEGLPASWSRPLTSPSDATRTTLEHLGRTGGLTEEILANPKLISQNAPDLETRCTSGGQWGRCTLVIGHYGDHLGSNA